MATKKGRRGSTGTFTDTVAPKSALQAVLLKQDEMIAKMNLILAAIEASTDGDSLQTELDTAAIKATISTVTLV